MLVITACSNASPKTVINDPPIVPQIQRTLLDVPYATQSRAQRTDLYLGDKALDANGPQRQMTTRGYAVTSLADRLTGAARYPAAVLDVKAALRFLRANATGYALSTTRIAAWGSSASGHLAALLGVTGDVALWRCSMVPRSAIARNYRAYRLSLTGFVLRIC